MGMGLEERVRSAVAALLYATGESQSVLGAVLGVSQAQVSRRQRALAAWTLTDCEAVAAHYGIDVSDLMAGPTRAVEALSAVRHRLGPRRPAAVEEGM
ncbi:helix-turn-helix domain-containing protein [Streptomyces sp. GbtcB6]|uniref:helix-turn-helix domain-containing protein n=1 Tax=Streptomyces sp. GbtcB6 TaxID=2824751 RepID=UPI001C308A9C|nr:helix-turn-helix domain-containing protein [Streptomyces sp. GbtcB6]